MSGVSVVVLAVGTVAGLSFSGFSAIPGVFAGEVVSTVGAVDFTRPLAIPPLAPSTLDDEGRRHFELTAAASTTEFVEGVPTPTWGFEGSYLGPTIRAEHGEEVVVDVTNELDEATTVHWHGMHLPAKMDGGPHQPVMPGDEWTPTWQVDQPAATLWYHPHPHGSTEEHVARGLAGMFIVTDPLERALGLPREYGIDDIPLIVQDVRFDASGAFAYRGGFVGSLGDRLLVNGTLDPYLTVATEVVRLRLLNASTARVYDFGFSDGRAFDQIASDGGLLEAPASHTHLRLSPGERAEILISMSPGESVVLRSSPPALGEIVPFGGPDGGADSFDVLQLRAVDELRSSSTTPTTLVPIERWDAADATTTRSFVLDGTSINDRNMELRRVDQTVTVGETEVWNVLNDMPRPHNFHVHGVQFQVAAIDGASPPAEMSGWKDTIYLEPGVPYRLLLRFEDYTDPDVPLMYHCHLLRHEDAGMMGQFVVVRPGEPAGIIAGSGHTH
ncbi:MAG: multicopper oxidase family protein [Microbacterium sp.]